MIYPSMYDLSLTYLDQFDWSRPLIVQAGPASVFQETVDVLTERLGLAHERVTLLTNASYQPGPFWRGRHFVNPEERLSARTPDLIDGFDRRSYSLVVVVSQVTIQDTYVTMRHHGNVACFCHALAPVPTLMVDCSGHLLKGFEGFFNLRDRQVGPHTVFGSVILSDNEIKGLYEAGLRRPQGAVVEVGRFAAGSAMVLACAGRDSGRRGVISIDIERLPAVDYLLDVNGFTKEDITLIDVDAHNIALNWTSTHPNEGVSLLFLDADHTYEGVARELQSWTPHLVPGALVAFHDVNISIFSVTRAVYNHVYRNPLFDDIEQFDSMVIAQYCGARQSQRLPHRDVTARGRRVTQPSPLQLAS
jgi:hypothetical protein